MEKLYNLFGILDVIKEDCIQALTSSINDYRLNSALETMETANWCVEKVNDNKIYLD